MVGRVPRDTAQTVPTMTTLRQASLVCLLIACGVFRGYGEAEMSSSFCDIILTTVRTEASPAVLHELCFDNNSVTFVVKCDKIWYERILDFCSTVGPHVWDISTDRLSISSPLTLQLVKSQKVVDSCSLNLTTQHLVHETISVLGVHKTRFVPTIEKDCSTFSETRAVERDPYVPEKSSNQVPLEQPKTLDDAEQLSPNKLNQHGIGMMPTTTENVLLSSSYNSESVVTTLQSMQTTFNIKTASTNTLKREEAVVRCSKSSNSNLENEKISSDYKFKSSLISEDSSIVGSSLNNNKLSSNNLDNQYKHFNTLTTTPRVHHEIVPHRVTSSDNYILKSDIPKSHSVISKIVFDQTSKDAFSKHGDDKTDNQGHRNKRNGDNKLDKSEPVISSLQFPSFPDKQSSLPAKVIDATPVANQPETIKQSTFGSHVAYEHNGVDSGIDSLVSAEASDSVLPIHLTNMNTIPNGAKTLQVVDTDIPLFPTLYSSSTNFDVHTNPSDLSDSGFSEYTFHEDLEMQSASVMHNSLHSRFYNSLVLKKAENVDHALETGVLAPSESVWTDISVSSLRTSGFPGSQDNQATKVESTHLHVIFSQSTAVAKDHVISSLVSSSLSSSHLFDSKTMDKEMDYLSENKEDEQITLTIMSASGSRVPNELKSELNYVPPSPELVIDHIENTNTFVTSSMIDSSPNFALPTSRETNIHPDPHFTEPLVSQHVTSHNVYISELTSSSQSEISTWADQNPLQSTTPLLIEHTTSVNELVTSPSIDLTTPPLIQLTKSSSWNLNIELPTVGYYSMEHFTVSFLSDTLTSPQRSEVNLSFEFSHVSLLKSSSIVPPSYLSDSPSITLPATRQSSAPASQASQESISVAGIFTEIMIKSSAATEPEQIWPTTGVPTPSQNSSTIVTPQARQDDIAGLDDDTVWPVVAALVIGIPVVIVLVIAITVIHRNRRQDPSKFFAMRTLNSSSQSSIATPRPDMSRESSVDV